MEQSERIFLDSNYWVALFNSNDALYPAARALARKLDKEKSALIISNFIFLEVVTVLSQRRGKEVAVAAGKYLFSDSIIRVHIDASLQKDTWSIFQQMKEKNISFVDCSTIALMRAERIDDLLTFDVKDFRRLKRMFRFRLYEA